LGIFLSGGFDSRGIFRLPFMSDVIISNYPIVIEKSSGIHASIGHDVNLKTTFNNKTSRLPQLKHTIFQEAL